MSPNNQIEVFADILCPFTHVGLKRLVERRDAAGRSEVGFWVRAWPLEVVNGKPLDAAFIAEEVDEIRRQVAPDLFEGFKESQFASTALPALALAHAAYRSSPEVGEAVSLELRDLVFERGVDVADPDVLDAVAAEHGLVPDEADRRGVMSDHEEGVARGVVGSPYFITAHGSYFCPSLSVGRDEQGRLEVRPDPAGMEQFLSAAFA